MTDTMRNKGIRKVAIIGVGAVGSTTAYAMIQAGAASEIDLVDLDRRRAEGEYMDLQHCLPFTDPALLQVRGMDEVSGCDAIVVTAGKAQAPGESRLDLVKRNTEIYAGFIPVLAKNNPGATLLLITNPVDVMARVAMKLSGFAPERVFGSGTVLDSARFRSLISQHCGVLPRHVHAYVVGEHGDHEVPVWSRAAIGPFHVGEYADLHKICLNPEDKERINNSVRTAAYEIIERKGATHFAIGLATVLIIEALGLDQSAVLTVSRCFEGAYRLRDVFLSMPTLVSHSGAHTQLELDLSQQEHKDMMRSAEVLDEVYQNLGIG
jgi:L-lactate dehydrogenase